MSAAPVFPSHPEAPSARHLILVALAGMAFFFPLLGTRDFWYASETRVAYAAREMRRGGEWVVPRDGADVRLGKPPMAYWLAAVASLPFDTEAGPGFDEFSCRLPNAFAGVAVMLLTYLLGCQLTGRRAALYGALSLGGMGIVWWQSRMAGIEMPHLAFNLAALYAWWRHVTRAEEDRVGWLVACYGMLGLSALQKGIGPALVLFIALTYLARTRADGHAFRWRHHLLGAAVLLALVLPWPILVAWRIPDAWQVWRQESLGRIEAFDHLESPFFFFHAMIADGMPWALPGIMGGVLVIGGRARQINLRLLGVIGAILAARWPSFLADEWRAGGAWAWVETWPVFFAFAALLVPVGWKVAGWLDRRLAGWTPEAQLPERAAIFLSTCCLVALFFFSFPESKNNHYILPIYPVLALLAGAVLTTAEARPEGTCARAVRGWCALFVVALVALAAVAAILPGRLEGTKFARYTVMEPLAPYLVLLAGMWAATLGAALRRGLPVLMWAAVMGAFVTGFMVYGAAHAKLDAYKSRKVHAQWMLPRLAADDRVILFGQPKDNVLQYYLARPVLVCDTVADVTRELAPPGACAAVLLRTDGEDVFGEALTAAGLSAQRLPDQPPFVDNTAWWRVSRR